MSQGKRNVLRAQLLARILDALMVHNASSKSCKVEEETERIMRMTALLRIRVEIENTLRQSSDSVFGKKKKINKKQRLGLALSQIDVTNMLVWWLAFFNNNDGVENDAFAETRNNRELQRWVLNAILDRLDVDVNGNERIDFVTRLAPHLLIDFERHRNHTDDTSTDENENDEDQSTQTASNTTTSKGKGKKSKKKKVTGKSFKKLADLSLCVLRRAFTVALDSPDEST